MPIRRLVPPLVVLMLLACRRDVDRTVAPPEAAPAAAIESIAYDLDVRIDPQRRFLQVAGTLQTERPRAIFWLAEALVIDELRDDDGAIEFRRDGARVETARPLGRARFRYHGRLVRAGERDFKSHAWILPTEVRLTEVTLWYPIFYDGEGDTPWPPEPATGRMSVAPIEGLHWVSSGVPIDRNRFEFRDPSDWVLVGVPFPIVEYAGEPTFAIASPRHAALAPTLRAAWQAHARRLGTGGAGAIHVVEFPATGTSSGLAFLSSNLIVLSSKSCDAVVENTARAQRVVAHEMAHRWFGGHLRPVGPATRWLVEAFAEYYAWLFVRERLGDAAWQDVLAEVAAEAGETPTEIPALGWADDRVYTAGALGVKALVDAVGQDTLDAAVRGIVEHHGEWSVASLLRELAASGADDAAVATVRDQWGLWTPSRRAR